MSGPLPNLGPDATLRSDAVCQRAGASWADVCGASPTVHVIWHDFRTVTPWDHAGACAEHWAEIERTWSCWSHHEFSVWCLMPGSDIYCEEREDGTVLTWCDATPEMHDWSAQVAVAAAEPEAASLRAVQA